MGVFRGLMVAAVFAAVLGCQRTVAQQTSDAGIVPLPFSPQRDATIPGGGGFGRDASTLFTPPGSPGVVPPPAPGALTPGAGGTGGATGTPGTGGATRTPGT